MTTGRALVKRVLSQPHLRFRYQNPRLLPIGARFALDTVAELVAASGEAMECRPDPSRDGGRTLVELIAHHAQAIGAEAELAGYLDALIRLGLVLATGDGGLRLALPSRAARPRPGPMPIAPGNDNRMEQVQP